MRGNIKALTNEEMAFILSKYSFTLCGDYITVITNNRKTLHDKNNSFSLLLPLERRRIKITTKAIDLWIKKYLDKYSLIEVQNAINTLVVTYQSITEENIDTQLRITRSKLDNLFNKGEN